MAGLAAGWEHLPADVRAAAIAAHDSPRGWRRAVRQLSTGREHDARALGLLACDTGDALLGRAVVGALGAPGTGGVFAEQGLIALAINAAECRGRAGTRDCSFGRIDSPVAAGFEPLGRAFCTIVTEEQRSALVAEINRAVERYSVHKRRLVFVAAMLVLDRDAMRPGSMPSWLRDEKRPFRSGLLGTLRATDHPIARLRAWEWLYRNEFTHAAVDRLGRASGISEHECVLRAGHLALRPARARALRAVESSERSKPASGHDFADGHHRTDAASIAPGGFVPSRAQIAGLSDSARLGLIRVVACLPLRRDQREQILDPLLVDSNPLVRHAAARSLPSCDDLCLDQDSRVAGSAMLRRARLGMGRVRGWGGDRDNTVLLTALTRSPHARVRGIAAQELGALMSSASRSGGESIENSGGASSLMSDALGEDPVRAHRAVMTLRRCGLAPRHEADLARVALQTLDEARNGGAGKPAVLRLLASAVAALGESRGDEARRIVTNLMTASGRTQVSASIAEQRVRANAVEAFARQERLRGVTAREFSPLLAELKNDSNHRVRANAIRAMLRVVDLRPTRDSDSSCESLVAMLGDERPAHRLAATWLAGRTLIGLNPIAARRRFGDRWSEIVARVEEASKFDDDGRVRARAEACIQEVRALDRSVAAVYN